MQNAKGYYPALESVALTPKNRFTENRGRTLEYLKLLPADTMLYSFRLTFGEDTRGARRPGGWDDPEGLLRGHSLGHFISALSLAYSATGDESFREKLDYIVGELSALQSKSHGRPRDFVTSCTPEDCGQDKWSRDPSVWGEGFISAYSPDQFALLEKFTPYAKIWAPYYTLHKIIAGLIECYDRTGNETALKVSLGIADWVYDRLSALTPEHRKKMWSMYIAGEYGGMNESLARLYTITGNEKYLECSKFFDNENIFPGLSEGRDTIANLHANQHIPQIMGAMLEYRATGDEYYHGVAKFFFDIVTEHHMYAIGGVGRGESFRDADKLAENIESDRNCETCAAYNMLKLSRELFSYEPEETKYMHYYERALINQILASQNPHSHEHMHNGVTYMLPIGPGATKDYSDDFHSFTCCHGTGMENHVKYQDAEYFISDSGDGIPTVYINLYISSELSLPELGIKITLESDFPYPKAKITLSGDADYAVRMRIPSWSQSAEFVSSVSKVVKSKNGRYMTASHRAGTVDVIRVSFDYSARLEYTPDTLDGTPVAALMYGPFVMVTADERRDFITLTVPEDINGALTPSINREAGSFLISGLGHQFFPIYMAGDMPYHTYFKINRSEDSK
ncbi:MAG: glycoside hydrolase family 127 protein [Firmicutes bacterium]|nr:glycoside hydrolase family 127 protein [Bacillota bacterium]